MGLNQIRTDSIRDMRLKSMGVTPPKDWNDVEQVREAKRQEIGMSCSARRRSWPSTLLSKRVRRRFRTTQTVSCAGCIQRMNLPRWHRRPRRMSFITGRIATM